MPRALYPTTSVKEFTERATTQWKPVVLGSFRPAPVRPFIYSNTYGKRLFVDLLRSRFIFAYVLWRERNKWHVVVAAVCALPVIPAAITQPRHVHRPHRHRRGWDSSSARVPGDRPGIIAAIGVGVGAWLATPARSRFLELSWPSSSDGGPRLQLPGRPCMNEQSRSWVSVPRACRPALAALSLGTQSVLTVIFSYGLVRTGPVPRLLPAHGPAHLAQTRYGSILGGIILATLVEQFLLRHEHGSHDSSWRSRPVAPPGGGKRPDRRAPRPNASAASNAASRGTVRAERAAHGALDGPRRERRLAMLLLSD